MITIGGTNIVKAFHGSTELKNIAIGDELLLSGEEPWVDEGYLTFEAIEDTTFSFRKTNGVKLTTYQDISYSLNGGKTWTTFTFTDNLTETVTTPLVKAGKKVIWKGNGTSTGVSVSHFCNFMSTGSFNVYGSIFSLFQGDNFKTGDHSTLGNLTALFAGAKVVDASRLDIEATSFTSMHQMFKSCTLLTTSPILTPTSVPNYGYYQMFNGCSSLTRITMLATSIGRTSALTQWVTGVAAEGTFVKNANMTTLPTGTAGIPSGWTVIDYSE